MSIRDLYKSAQVRQAPRRIRLKSTQLQADEPEFDSASDVYHAVKNYLHRQILRQVDLSQFDPERDRAAFETAVSAIIKTALAPLNVPLAREEKDRLLQDTISEAVGLGPLGALLDDPAVSDILVNGPYKIYVERHGKLELTSIKFQSDEHLMGLIERIVGRVGRHIDQQSPMVNARLPDGSRIHAVIPPLSLTGPILSIRRFGQRRIDSHDLIQLGALPKEMLAFLEALVASRMNLMVSGGTGSGKTTLLNVLSSFIGQRERIITIEDAAELLLNKEHVVRLETRPPNIEGRGEITIRDLVLNALRMRPDRIVVGEIRGGEAFDMLQALSTGHDGGMTTIHANAPRDALKRLEAMVLMAGFELPSSAIRQFISSALDMLVHVERMADGSRKIVSIVELTGMEKDTLLTQELFRYQIETQNAGRTTGRHYATGVVPRCIERLRERGFNFENDFFKRERPLS